MRFKIWDEWYAWYPVFVSGEWVWLKTVLRKRNYLFNSPRADGYPVNPVESYWVYRNVEEGIQD